MIAEFKTIVHQVVEKGTTIPFMESHVSKGLQQCFEGTFTCCFEVNFMEENILQIYKHGSGWTRHKALVINFREQNCRRAILVMDRESSIDIIAGFYVPMVGEEEYFRFGTEGGEDQPFFDWQLKQLLETSLRNEYNFQLHLCDHG